MQRAVLKHSTVLPENIFFFFFFATLQNAPVQTPNTWLSQINFRRCYSCTEELLKLFSPCHEASKDALSTVATFFSNISPLCLAILLRVINTRTHLYSLSPLFFCLSDWWNRNCWSLVNVWDHWSRGSHLCPTWCHGDCASKCSSQALLQNL